MSTTVEVYTDAAMTTLAFPAVVKSSGDLTSVEVTGHSYATSYYARAKYTGNSLTSNWSTTKTYSTVVPAISAPTINLPVAGSNDNAEVVTFDLSDFAVVPTSYNTHSSTTVEVYRDAAMTDLLASVTKSSGDLTQVDVSGHVVSTTYYARAKYTGNSLTSNWSATRSYTTKAVFALIYGVEWNPSNDTYTRTGLANGTANSTSYAGAIHTQMKRCVLNANGTVAYYLHPTDSTKKADGTAATIDGSAGNVMVEIPKFYYKYENVSGVHKWSVCPIAETGFTVHPAFVKAGAEVAKRYYPAYGGYYDGSKLISGSGKTPTASQTRATFRGYARNNGTGWGLIDWNILSAVQLLFITEYATFDTQAMLGNGNDTGSDYAMTTGGSNGIGNGSSPATNDDTWMSYRGIENWYASMWKFIDGVNVQERLYYVSNDPGAFADDTFSGTYVSTGMTATSGDGYISDLVASGKGFVASAVSGSSSTKVPDYFYTGAGNRVVFFGGAAGLGLNAGGFYVMLVMPRPMLVRISARVSATSNSSRLCLIWITTSKGGIMGKGFVIFSSNTDNGLNAGRFYVNANNATSNANSNIDSGDLLPNYSMPFPCLYGGGTKNYAPLCVGREIEDSGVITRR